MEVGLFLKKVIVMDKRGEYKIKEKHIINLNKLYDKVVKDSKTLDEKSSSIEKKEKQNESDKCRIDSK